MDVLYSINSLLVDTGVAFILSGAGLEIGAGGLTKQGNQTFEIQNNVELDGDQTWLQSTAFDFTTSGAIDLGDSDL